LIASDIDAVYRSVYVLYVMSWTVDFLLVVEALVWIVVLIHRKLS